jgi:hypothetical protein
VTIGSRKVSASANAAGGRTDPQDARPVAGQDIEQRLAEAAHQRRAQYVVDPQQAKPVQGR